MSDPTATSTQTKGHLAHSQRTAQAATSLMGKLAMLLRASAALALTVPVICGTVLGWWEQGQFDAVNFLFVGLGAVAGALSINALWEYIDYRRGLAIDHYEAKLLPDSGYSIMRSGRIDPNLPRNLGLMLGGVSIICGLLLALLAGWPMLFFTLLSYLLALFYAAPPIRYGYRGWGLGEIGVFVSFGLLGVSAGYYAVTRQLSWATVAAALPLGLLAVLVVFNYNILRYRRDWLIRKRTLVVSLGPARGLDVSIVLVVAAYGSLVLVASLGYLPLWTLLSLGGLPIVLGAYSEIWRGQTSLEDLSNLYMTTLNAVVITGFLFCLALWLDMVL